MTQNRHTDQELLSLLKENGELAIERIFKQYFPEMTLAVHRLLQDENMAKDIVQDVFFKFWTNRDQLNIQSSLKGYLKRSCVNAALDYLRKRKNFRKVESEEILVQSPSSMRNAAQNLETEELQAQVNAAIESLHPKCRTVFILSRKEELTYREIAEKLDISVKTVESHMGTALKKLRVLLKPYLSVLIVFGYFF